jgi:hypothetical protein
MVTLWMLGCAQDSGEDLNKSSVPLVSVHVYVPGPAQAACTWTTPAFMCAIGYVFFPDALTWRRTTCPLPMRGNRGRLGEAGLDAGAAVEGPVAGPPGA